MCMCLWRSRGRVLGEGIRSIVLPPCPPQATKGLIWQLQGGTWKDQNRNQSPPFLPPPFLWRERKRVCLIALWRLGLALCQCRGGGRRAGSVNAYHDHNRANKHSSAMKAQRERLRIPGLTLEWVFSCFLTSGSSSAVCSFTRLCVIFVAVFHCCFKLCAALALAAAAASAAGSLMSNPSQLGNSGRLVCVCVFTYLCFHAHVCDRRINNMSRKGVSQLHNVLYLLLWHTQETHTS